MEKPQRLAHLIIFQHVLHPLRLFRLPRSDLAVPFRCGGGGSLVLLMTSHGIGLCDERDMQFADEANDAKAT